jgi:hypothetical protein
MDTAYTKNPEPQLNRLQQLLEKQIDSIRKGDLASLEILSEQTTAIVAGFTPLQRCMQPPIKNRLMHIMQLYYQLELMIQADKELIQQQLQKIGNGKKTLSAYQ